MTQLPKSSCCSWLQVVIGIVIGIAIISGLLTIQLTHDQRTELSPGRQLCERIQEGMREEEVDAILSDHQSVKGSEIREFDNNGVRLERKSTYMKNYYKSEPMRAII